jgi:hypothetical protein
VRNVVLQHILQDRIGYSGKSTSGKRHTVSPAESGHTSFLKEADKAIIERDFKLRSGAALQYNFPGRIRALFLTAQQE